MKKLAICLLLGSCVHGQNVVTDWAAIVNPIVNTPPKPPWVLHILRAPIQLAVYDAVVAIQHGYTPYAAAIPASSGADVRAAVATAAYRAARPVVTPAQSVVLDAQYDAYMAMIPDGDGKKTGMAVGQSAAAAVQALRTDDGFNRIVLYDCGPGAVKAGRFEPNGGCNTQPLNPNLGQIKTFALPSASQFRPAGPNPMTSTAYLEDFVETRDYGRSNSTVRTAEQTDIAYFWQGVDQHQGFINLAISRGLNVRDSARFFALIYTVAADAAIAGFDAKYYYAAWRPRTAIPRAAEDGNPDTDPDATWTPLLSVDHPEYPSAHAFISTAIVDATARFFGTSKVAWTLKANKAAFPQLVKTERTYPDLNAQLNELYNARVWAGLHWRHSMLDGAEIGRKVAAYIYDNFFQP